MKTFKVICFCISVSISSCSVQERVSIAAMETSIRRSNDKNNFTPSRLKLLKNLRSLLFKRAEKIGKEFVLVEELGDTGSIYRGILYSKSQAYSFEIDYSENNYDIVIKETTIEILFKENTIQSCLLFEILENNIDNLLLKNKNTIDAHAVYYVTIAKKNNMKFHQINSLCMIDSKGNAEYNW